MWLRLLLGCLVVLVASAIAGATFVLDEVNTLSEALSKNGSVKVGGQLAPSSFGGAETFLLVGDDTRSVFKYYKGVVPDLANEMLLVRLDPSKPWISMMSIPRELWVTIYPPNGRLPYTNRINSAYTSGIPTLLSTIKRVTGLAINHVVVINFKQFENAVNQMGCVYSTVDRRYYHVNAPGGEQYQEIDLQPGYQDMCGTAAEQFVSYRHGDTSLVRDARDQSFLLDVKKQYGPTLADNVHKFEKIFGASVKTDAGLHSTTGILDLLGTLISASSLRVRQVHFNATLLPNYDTASPEQVAASVHSFLYGGSSLPASSATAALAKTVHNHKKAVATLPLIAVPSLELKQAQDLATTIPFPVEYPLVQDRGGSSAPVDLRSYHIHAPGGDAYPIYVAAFYGGQLGQYYDVQGTTWTTAPQFDSPDQTVQVGTRTYSLYYEGQHLKMVAWYAHNAVYWIRNSLTDAIGNGEMLAIAEQTAPLSGAHTSTPTASLTLTIHGAPAAVKKKTVISTRQLLGALSGLLTLAALPLLIVPLLRRRRERSELRGRMVAAAAHTGQLGVALRGGPMPAPLGPAPGQAAARLQPEGMTIYGRGRSFGRAWYLPVAASVAAIGAVLVLGAIAISENGNTTPTTHRLAAPKPMLPTLPVSVLNATSTPGAAARMGTQLKAAHVTVGSVGNLVETRPPGLMVLYAPGARDQAVLLAKVIGIRESAIAPIDPVAQAAAGASAQLVVVIA
jgi:LCP family protein required for cell wall assembly